MLTIRLLEASALVGTLGAIGLSFLGVSFVPCISVFAAGTVCAFVACMLRDRRELGR